MRNSYRRSGGNRRNNNYNRRSRHRQATFDPTPVILASQADQTVARPQDEYQVSNTFADFALVEQLQHNISERGYADPTPIQDQVIPHILQNTDVVGIANTGTGKTAAFLLPLVHKVVTNRDDRVLVIAPTRELAMQIQDELRSFSQKLQVYSTLCIGGASMHRQIEGLRRQPQFVIGTPGRIKDLHQRRKLHFDQFSTIVLDEVDRMLDMGFIHDIKQIVADLPAERHSLFFSATMTDRVREIMHGFLTNPEIISVKTQETSANVKQELLKIDGRSKIDLLHDLLETDGFEKVIVFGRTKRGMERLSRDLRNRGLQVTSIHGNKSQSQRQRALRDFRNDTVQALVATDVVARGLDVDNITHVINYDLPESYEDYIHRIGRTGRADKEGVAITFVG